MYLWRRAVGQAGNDGGAVAAGQVHIEQHGGNGFVVRLVDLDGFVAVASQPAGEPGLTQRQA